MYAHALPRDIECQVANKAHDAAEGCTNRRLAGRSEAAGIRGKSDDGPAAQGQVGQGRETQQLEIAQDNGGMLGEMGGVGLLKRAGHAVRTGDAAVDYGVEPASRRDYCCHHGFNAALDAKIGRRGDQPGIGRSLSQPIHGTGHTI